MSAPGSDPSRATGEPPARARTSGALYVHLQSQGGVEHRTIVLSPRTAAVLRTVWSRWGVCLALAIAGSWVYFGIQSARVPPLTRRVSELQAEARRIDTLQARLQALQDQYDQVHRMLGAAIADTVRRAPTESPPRKQ